MSTATRAMATTLLEAVADGHLDAYHPLAKKWLAQRPQRGPRPGHHPPPTNESSTADSTNLNLRKKTAEVAILESKVEKDRGSVISRALVQHHVLGLVDATFKRLIVNFPQTVATRLGNAVRAKLSLEDQVSLVRSMVTTELGSLKSQAVRAIRRSSASGTLEPCDDSQAERIVHETSQIRAFSEALRAELASTAAPSIVNLVAKTIAREAAGKPLSVPVFDAAMKLTDVARDDATHAATTILYAAVTEALRAALAEPMKEENTDENAK